MDSNLLKELKKYSHLATLEKLKKITERPVKLCPGEFKYLIPSIIMGSDGPVLESLNLVTSTSMCEVRVNVDAEDFDLVGLNLGVCNYRISLSEQIIKRDGDDDLEYKLGEVKLYHTDNLTSIFNYVGSDDERERWLELVFDTFPITEILRWRSNDCY